MDRRQNNGSVNAVSPRHCPATCGRRKGGTPNGRTKGGGTPNGRRKVGTLMEEGETLMEEERGEP